MEPSSNGRLARNSGTPTNSAPADVIPAGTTSVTSKSPWRNRSRNASFIAIFTTSHHISERHHAVIRDRGKNHDPPAVMGQLGVDFYLAIKERTTRLDDGADMTAKVVRNWFSRLGAKPSTLSPAG
jgi:hypothetical protein